ncbi:phosphate acetyltransferase [Parenemella sanctibonifatiensis]|uniref:phosphate acetyltransferase n=1 Tax=Parenemella sanctibonifatiensis TaxID=2016505 RepID=UPI001E4FBB8A|nr:phosphate acetyltransferase [Parenemella sanctibonifatiensis]
MTSTSDSVSQDHPATRIVIASAEGHTGKSIVALGLVAALSRRVRRVGVFRPVARGAEDDVLAALLDHEAIDLGPEEATGVSYDDVHRDPEAALATIVERFHAIEDRFDAMVILGSDYTDVASPTELGFNARIAANLGASVVLVLGGIDPDRREPRTPADLQQLGQLAMDELASSHATLGAIIVNRAATDPDEAVRTLSSLAADVPVWAIPENPVLGAPTFGQLLEATRATLTSGEEALLDREVLGVVVAGMSMENVLERLIEGAVIVIPADRSDVIVGTLLAQQSGTFPTLSGIILNGGFELAAPVQRLLDGLRVTLPVAASPLGTYDTARSIAHTRGSLLRGTRQRRELALATFEDRVDVDALLEHLHVSPTTVITPLIFEHQLVSRARANRRRIVLPEGSDDRVLEAASLVLRRGIADITLLGEEEQILGRAAELGLDLDQASILSTSGPQLRGYAEEYARLRAHKGMTLEAALDRVKDVSYFGTMMVQTGDADGMVSGAMHTTAHTIRPSFEVIKTKPGVKVVSSVFLMALADRVLVYGDCAVIPEPSPEELADIAITSAATAREFGIEPRVAMLSYSTGESGSGAEVDRVREATALVRERAPELLVAGPIQYDAAADPSVGAKKMPDNPVAGNATVFVFPDLNTGNNTYKAVQRSAGAVAMGPVLQGLNKPVNDLSRGATVPDIVNTIAITAIQAGAK